MANMYELEKTFSSRDNFNQRITKVWSHHTHVIEVQDSGHVTINEDSILTGIHVMRIIKQFCTRTVRSYWISDLAIAGMC